MLSEDLLIYEKLVPVEHFQRVLELVDLALMTLDICGGSDLPSVPRPPGGGSCQFRSLSSLNVSLSLSLSFFLNGVF